MSALNRRAFFRRVLLQAGAVFGAAWAGSRLEWWSPLIGQSAGNGVSGIVHDLLTGDPVAGAEIEVTGGPLGLSIAAAVADAHGRYHLPLAPGRHEVQVSAPGYISMALGAHVAREGGGRDVDFALLPAHPTTAQQEAIYAKVVRAPESPLPELAVQTTTVTVPDTIVVQWPDGSRTTMPLDYYLRHVVPAEMPASWPFEALRAQAVAARSYAIAYYLARGYICATTSCQYYGEATYSTTDQAVWSTHNQVATYNGAIIWANYFAQCNGVTTRNSEEALANTGYGGTCTVSGWNYSPYLRARSCSGHAPYYYSTCGYHGHGVGMCQWGARGFADQGLSYDQILNRYYTGIQVNSPGGCGDSPPQLLSPYDGYVAEAGTSITLAWTGSSENYKAFVVDGDGNVRWMSAGGAGTSATVPGTLRRGNYYWYVTGYTGSCAAGTSARRRFRLRKPPGRPW